jgi:hypothetical protein
LSKRLKKRIIELCGFSALNRTEKLSRANDVLNSTDIKNSICNQLQGASFKDVEKAMISIINERQITEEEQELLDLEAQVPEKFDHEFQFKLKNEVSDKKKETRYRTYTREEVAALMAASKAPTVSKSEPPPDRYPPGPYPQELIDMQRQLIREHFEYKETEKKKRQQEKEKWENSLKTSESDAKTENTMKPMSSIKTSKRLDTPTKK